MAKVQGLVLEAGDGWAIVLLPGGDYKRIKTREPLQVGQLYRFTNTTAFKYASVAAVFIIITIVSLDFFSVTARANVSPGINLGLNRWNRVISVDTSNTASEMDIKNLSLPGKSLDQAINLIVTERKNEIRPGSEAPENTEISVSLAIKSEKDKQRKEKLLTIIDTSLKQSTKSQGKSSTTKVIRKDNKLIVIDQPSDSGKTAKSSGNSLRNPGKVKPQQKLQEQKINPSALKNRSGKGEHDEKPNSREHKLMPEPQERQGHLPKSAVPQNKKIDSNNGIGNQSRSVERKEKNQPQKDKHKEKQKNKLQVNTKPCAAGRSHENVR